MDIYKKIELTIDVCGLVIALLTFFCNTIKRK